MICECVSCEGVPWLIHDRDKFAGSDRGLYGY